METLDDVESLDDAGAPTRFIYVAMEKCKMTLFEKRRIMASDFKDRASSNYMHWILVSQMILDVARALQFMHGKGTFTISYQYFKVYYKRTLH